MPVVDLKDKRFLPWGGQYAQAALDGDYHQAGSVREAMVQAGLNWTVEKTDAYHLKLTDSGVGYEAIEDQRVLRRTSDQKPLMVVGKDYNPYQNHELAAFTDSFVKLGAIGTVGMGETDGGKRVFTVVKIDDSNDLGTFVIVVNGHGGLSLTCMALTIEWACLNGMVGFVPDTAYMWKVKHTKNMRSLVRQQQLIMARSVNYVEKVHNLYEQLLNTPIDEGTVREANTKLFPITPDTKEATRTNHLRRRHSILRTWQHSPTMDEATQHTGWGYVHAVTEWDQHSQLANSRRRTDDMTRLVNDRWSNIGTRARDLMLAI